MRYKIGDYVRCRYDVHIFNGTIKYISPWSFGIEVSDDEKDFPYMSSRHDCDGSIVGNKGWYVDSSCIIGFVEIPYDPAQQGDTEDDI